MARLLGVLYKLFAMNKLLRALIAGWGAKKIGGGCISTIIVFIIIYYALGTCNSHPVQTVPQKHSGIRGHDHRTLQAFIPKVSLAFYPVPEKFTRNN
jgi:hypothetical protein